MATEREATANRRGQSSIQCPACLAGETATLIVIDGRSYHRCMRCEATFLDPDQRPGRDEELAHYDTHENDPADPRYRDFLNRLASPLLERMPDGLSGLDYGCGPGPALAQMMCEAGHTMATFDPFYAPDRKVLEVTYDFITCTEVVEHFHRPHAEFSRINNLLRPGGWLGVMTMFQTDDARFANWHYRKDPTHVVFYRETTLRRLAEDFGWSCEIPARNIALFRKPA
ncbi:MAG: class I SAM-dependent methyltransferase [Pseudomonadota bacterium]